MQAIFFRIQIIFLIFFLVTTTIFGQKKQPYNPNKKFSAEALKEDFQFLRAAITDYHAGAFSYISSDSLNKVFDNYEKSLIDSLTERQFRNQLYACTEVVKCGHSGISSSKERQKYFKNKPVKILPLNLYYIDSQIVVINNFSKDSTIKIGSIVKSIDGVLSDKIIKTMFDANSSDGFNLTNRYYSFERGLQFEYTRHYSEKDTFSIAIMDSIQMVKLHKVAAMISDSFPFQKPKNLKSLYKNKENRFFLSEKDSTIAIFDLQSEKMMGYKKFYKKSFKYLKNNELDKLIIDLRGNGGGFMLNPGCFLSYLIPMKDYVEVVREKRGQNLKEVIGKRSWVRFTEHFFPLFPNVKRVKNNQQLFQLKITFKPKNRFFYKGNVVLLADGGTFSAASYIAAYLKKYDRATFIGNETGGGEAGCNAFLMPHIKLPNTKLQYRLPLYKVKHNTSPKLIGRGVIPDIFITYQKDNILKMKDLEMEKAIEILNKKR